MHSDYDYRPEILACIRERMDFMISHHCKVLFVRFDVRFPDGYPHDGSNREMSQFMKLLKEFYTDQLVLVHYIWVREQVNSAVPHYHVVLLVNGSKIQNPMGIWLKAQEVWNRVVGVTYSGLINFCRHQYRGQPGTGSIMIRRPSATAVGESLQVQQQEFDQARAAALERADYLAKTYSKGNAPYRVREYGASQL